MKKNKPTVIDLFCGAGGLSKGFEMAGYEVLFGLDNIETFVKTFKENHNGTKALCDDIREVTVNKIRKAVGNRKINVVAGGPPCQGFSMAGKRDTKDPRNSLFMDFVRIVEGLEPDYFVMENVRGLLSMKNAKGQKVVDIIKKEFKKIGYEVDMKVLLAADYGVPQKRNRVIFIGTKNGSQISFPDPTHFNLQKGSLGEETQGGKKLKRWVPVKEVLLDKKDVDISFFHSQKMIEGFRKRQKKNREKGHGFGWQILNPEKPSYTISARYYKDGADALVKYSDDEIRMLTPKECALIQSFPPNYKFVGSKRDQYTQIGNAVPPLLAKAIADHLKDLL